MTDSNATQRFLGSKHLWPGLSLELEEYRLRQGRRRLFLYGTGHAVVQLISPDNDERRFEFRLSREEIQQLQRLLVQHDLVTIKSVYRPELPDDMRLTLTLCNTQGRHEIVSKQASVADARFDAIYAPLVGWADQAQQGKPRYTGPLVYYYRPGKGLADLPWKLRKMVAGLWDFELRDVGRFLAEFLATLFHLRYLLLLTAAVGSVLLVAAYIWAEVDPMVSYGPAGGLIHGFFWLQNGILSLFTERYVWAPNNTGTLYNVGFAAGVSVIPWLVKLAFQVIYYGLATYLRR